MDNLLLSLLLPSQILENQLVRQGDNLVQKMKEVNY